jgi:hypothetical protein
MKHPLPNLQVVRDSAKVKGLTPVARGLTHISPGLRVQTPIKAGPNGWQN